MHCVLMAWCHHGHQHRKVKYYGEKRQRGEDVVSMTTSGKEQDCKKLKFLCLSVLFKGNLQSYVHIQYYFCATGFCASYQSQTGTKAVQMVHGSFLLCLYIPGVIYMRPNCSRVNNGDQIWLSFWVHMHIHKSVLRLNVCTG